MRYTFFVFVIILLSCSFLTKAQQRVGQAPVSELDSLRRLEEEGLDTVIFTSKYIRYTTIGLLKDSTQTVPLDTTLKGFHNYNPINQPERPTLNLGNMGLAARDMLFNPSRTIGFDAGFHSLDAYRFTQDSVKYYRARTPYTSLYFVSGLASLKEQVFKVTHSQNIKPNWNVGANYFRIGSSGFYPGQNVSNLNAAVFSWYESPRKRYNILVNGLFNTLKAGENGSLVNDTIFNSAPGNNNVTQAVRLAVNASSVSDQVKQVWKQKNLYLKQFYYIGRIDSLTGGNSSSNILPTQRISHSMSYSSDNYKFYKNQDDPYDVFPASENDAVFVSDSTVVKNLRNELMYSFYLRGRSVSFIKNELKLDLGMQHDLYWYRQMSSSSSSFQNVSLLGNIGYQFSDKVSINGHFRQIAQGRNAGDYLYDAQAQFMLSRSVGQIVLGAYIQNKSPERIFEQVNYTYHKWQESFTNTKINNFSFAYLNPKFRFKVKGDYYLLNNYMYFEGSDSDLNQIVPAQSGSINLLKVSLNKDFHFGRFNTESFVVYQKTDYQSILRTPELYAYNSFYYGAKFFNAFTANLGFDIRWNSKFAAPSYAINVSQFYNGTDIKYENYPVVDLWARLALRRANVFIRYDYLNQGWLSRGYYTVSRYPMPDALLKFGVAWNFYN